MGFLKLFKKEDNSNVELNETEKVLANSILIFTDDNQHKEFLFKFNRKKFFDGYRKAFGPLNDSLVESLDVLLDQIECDDRFKVIGDFKTPRRQLAYCLATFKWETAHTMRPIKEYGGNDYFNRRYGPQTKVGKVLGNTKSGDGAKYPGRGFVQLTGKNNYIKAGKYCNIDLVNNPEKACDAKIAYKIAIVGMLEGWFTGKKLSDYFKDGEIPKWESARRIINGVDKAAKIASIAQQFDEILLNSLISI